MSLRCAGWDGEEFLPSNAWTPCLEKFNLTEDLLHLICQNRGSLIISLLPITPKTLGLQLVHTCSILFLLTYKAFPIWSFGGEVPYLRLTCAFYSSGVRSARRAKSLSRFFMPSPEEPKTSSRWRFHWIMENQLPCYPNISMQIPSEIHLWEAICFLHNSVLLC